MDRAARTGPRAWEFQAFGQAGRLGQFFLNKLNRLGI